MEFFRHNWTSTLALLLLLLAIPLTITLGQRVQVYLAEAAVVPANITIDAAIEEGPLPQPGSGFSQGGELEYDGRTLVSIAPLSRQLSGLHTKYIRLDHLLDYPLEARLREVVAVASMGATPVISLSYFPSNVASTDTALPFNWIAWENAVANLIAQVSGFNTLNIPNVYYEVWNEPDGRGFGGWRIGPGLVGFGTASKDYMELYRHTIAGSRKVFGVQPFKIGGPALADPGNTAFLDNFLAAVDRENLRLDFISWHRYHPDVGVFRQDQANIAAILAKYPRLSGVEKLVTEWGTYPETNVAHDLNYDAAHFVSVVRTFLDGVNIATKFEIRDGPGRLGSGFGMFTYHGSPKPLAVAAALVASVSGQRVSLSGEGSSVTGFAARDGDNLRIILANYDKISYHTEGVPIAVSNLPLGNYLFRKTILDGYSLYGRTEETNLSLVSNTLSFQQPMLVNSVVLLEFLKQ